MVMMVVVAVVVVAMVVVVAVVVVVVICCDGTRARVVDGRPHDISAREIAHRHALLPRRAMPYER